MSQRNVELHALAVAAVNAREVPEDLLAPGFCLENRAFAATDYVYRGAAGWRDWMSDLLEEFTGPTRCEIEEIITATDELVIATVRMVGRNVRSATPLSLRWTSVTWFGAGKLIRTAGYATRAQAFRAAVALPPQEPRLTLRRELTIAGC